MADFFLLGTENMRDMTDGEIVQALSRMSLPQIETMMTQKELGNHVVPEGKFDRILRFLSLVRARQQPPPVS
jgi:hypothetical protein